MIEFVLVIIAVFMALALVILCRIYNLLEDHFTERCKPDDLRLCV